MSTETLYESVAEEVDLAGSALIAAARRCRRVVGVRDRSRLLAAARRFDAAALALDAFMATRSDKP